MNHHIVQSFGMVRLVVCNSSLVPNLFLLLSQCDSQLLDFGIEASIKLIMRTWVSRWKRDENGKDKRLKHCWCTMITIWRIGKLHSGEFMGMPNCASQRKHRTCERWDIERNLNPFSPSPETACYHFAEWWDMMRSRIHTFGGTKKLSPPSTHQN